MRYFIGREVLSTPSLRLLTYFPGLYNLNSGVWNRPAGVLNISREVINTSDAVFYRSGDIACPFVAPADLNSGVWNRSAEVPGRTE